MLKNILKWLETILKIHVKRLQTQVFQAPVVFSDKVSPICLPNPVTPSLPFSHFFHFNFPFFISTFTLPFPTFTFFHFHFFWFDFFIFILIKLSCFRFHSQWFCRFYFFWALSCESDGKLSGWGPLWSTGSCSWMGHVGFTSIRLPSKYTSYHLHFKQTNGGHWKLSYWRLKKMNVR